MKKNGKIWDKTDGHKESLKGEQIMTENQIKRGLAYAGTNQRKVAQILGMTPQAFGMRIKRETFSDEALKRIAKEIGAEYKCYFEFHDGIKI